MLARQYLLSILLLFSFDLHALQASDPAPAPEIKVTETPEDSAIARRVTEMLAAIDTAAEIDVSVTAGVVTLEGTVPSSRLGKDLVAITERVEGVVYVQNQLTEEMDLPSRLEPTSRKLHELGVTVLRLLPVALVALAVVVFFWLVGRWAGSKDAWLRRIGLTELTSNLGKRIVRLSITAIGLLIALEILDATALAGALLGVAGVFGIAVGFAFRNIVENYLAGVLLSARNPFEIGDLVQVGEFNGNVMRLTSRDTVLMTRDGNHLRIPNSVIITSAMTNFTRNPLRRFEFTVGVAVEVDLVVARNLGLTTLRKMPGVLHEPAPQALITELADSNVQLRFLAWIDQRDSDFLKARSEAIRLVKVAFDAAGIEMPEPIYRVRFKENVKVTAAPADDTDRTAPVTSDGGAHQAGYANTAADIDVSADHTIDDQVAAELLHSDEENLLPRTDLTGQ